MVNLGIGLLMAKRPTVDLTSEELEKKYKKGVDASKKVSKSCFKIFFSSSLKWIDQLTVLYNMQFVNFWFYKIFVTWLKTVCLGSYMTNSCLGLSRLWIFKISNFWGRIEQYWELTLSVKQFLSAFADIKPDRHFKSR